MYSVLAGGRRYKGVLRHCSQTFCGPKSCIAAWSWAEGFVSRSVSPWGCCQVMCPVVSLILCTKKMWKLSFVQVCLFTKDLRVALLVTKIQKGTEQCILFWKLAKGINDQVRTTKHGTRIRCSIRFKLEFLEQKNV